MLRGSSSPVGMGAASTHFSHRYFVTLSWMTTGAATRTWRLYLDLPQQLNPVLSSPTRCVVMGEEVGMDVLTHLLTVYVVQSSWYDKQMRGGFIKHVYKNIAICLKLEFPV